MKIYSVFPPSGQDVPACKIMSKNIDRISKNDENHFFKYVGIHLDENLSFQSHIEQIELKVSRNLGIIYSAKKSIPINMKLILYNALIKPYMEYGIELWGSAKVKQLKKINKLNKMAIRMVFNKLRTDPISDLMMSNRILTFKMLHKYALLKLGYEIANKYSPTSLQCIFELEDPTSRRSMNFKIPYLISNLRKFPKVTLPKQWNLLDDAYKGISTLKLFKRSTKLHLLNA